MKCLVQTRFHITNSERDCQVSFLPSPHTQKVLANSWKGGICVQGIIEYLLANDLLRAPSSPGRQEDRKKHSHVRSSLQHFPASNPGYRSEMPCVARDLEFLTPDLTPISFMEPQLPRTQGWVTLTPKTAHASWAGQEWGTPASRMSFLSLKSLPYFPRSCAPSLRTPDWWYRLTMPSWLQTDFRTK